MRTSATNIWREIKKSIETLGASLQRKVDKTEFEGLKNKIDEIEKEIETIKKDAQEEGSWTGIKTATEKRKIEEVIDISLRDYENEEKERQNRRKNIIVFGLPESEKTIPEEHKEDDVKKMVGLCKNICKIKFNENDHKQDNKTRKSHRRQGETIVNNNK